MPDLLVAVLVPQDIFDTLDDARFLGVRGREAADHWFVQTLREAAPAHDVELALVVTPNRPRPALPVTPPRGRSGHTAVKRDTVPFRNLPEFLLRRRVDVVHELDPSIHRALYLRNNVARYPFAVTGVTHSLAYAVFHEWMLLNLLGAPQPCDRLICTTPTAQRVVASYASAVNTWLAEPQQLATETIPLGVPFASFGVGNGPALRARWGIPAASVVVLSFGRLDRHTKADLRPLFVAMQRVMGEAAADTRLIVAGASHPNGYAATLQRYAFEFGLNGGVHIVENPSEEIKRDLYSAADIFVAPADNVQETFGLVLLEAAAAGLPIVASDWDGYRSLVVDGETGYLVPTYAPASFAAVDCMAPLFPQPVREFLLGQAVATDVDSLANRVVQLADHPDERKRLGEAARRRAATFDWTRIVAMYVDLWRRLAAERGRCAILPGRPPTLDFASAFCDYPTRTLYGSEIVTTTAAGEAVIQGTPLRPHGELAGIVSPTLVYRVLTAARHGTVVGNICRDLQAQASRAIVEFHLVWLLKQGLLSLKHAGKKSC